MQKTETIEGFYLHNLDHLPNDLHHGIGHFNVFRRDEFGECLVSSTLYNRKNYFKINLVVGKSRIYYADKVLNIEQQALFFTNPQIPYRYEFSDEKQSGFFCIFTETFFSQFGHVGEYPVFKPGASPLFELSGEQSGEVEAIFMKMLAEIQSDYAYKHDMLRTLTFELIHYALKLKPTEICPYSSSTAYTRITSLFTELLEKQFPIESIWQRITLRTPAQYADHLAVHVNYLNRVLKETTGKTTSHLIAERVAQEARALLRHTDWTIGEIAWCLGFDELPHFNKFFRRQVQLTPKSYRVLELV